MGPLGVVADQVFLEVDLHLSDRLVELLPSLDPEVFVQQCTVQPLDEAVALRPADLRGPMFDLLDLQEQLVRMLIRATAELAAVVREDRVDPGAVLLEERQHVVVERLDGRQRQLAGVQLAPGVAAVRVDHRLQVDLPDALEGADEERVHGHQIAGPAGLDVPLAELGAEPLEQADLRVGQLDLAVADVLLEAQQPVVLGQQVVPAPDPAHTAGAHVDPLQVQVLGDAQAALGRVGEAVVQNGLLDLVRHPVRVRALRAGQAVDQPVRPVGLVVAADLVELLTAVAGDLAGLADVAHFVREF